MSPSKPQVQLTGITPAGEALVVEFGAMYTVEKRADKVAFDPRRHDWLLLRPVTGCEDRQQLGSRWVHLTRDEQFAVKELRSAAPAEPEERSWTDF